ncbi:MAG: hypothetical protein H7A35_09025 [Planctomycetales bacterium]|nr:hypothetical protein [bacterium]UNM07020.1 MAG: hypothetical protein H7A35_09025 [Planctomycetales bacterium]
MAVNTKAPENAEFYSVSVDDMRNWPERSLPQAIPEDIRKLAVRVDSVHRCLAGREAWLWNREGLRRLLDHLAGMGRDERMDAGLAIDIIRGYRFIGGMDGFAELAIQAGGNGELEPARALVELGYEPEDMGEKHLLYDLAFVKDEEDSGQQEVDGRATTGWRRLRSISVWLVIGFLVYSAGSLFGEFLGMVTFAFRSIFGRH